MEVEVTIEHEGTPYTATYLVVGDELIVYLPNGEPRATVLRGLNPESAARQHLRSYIRSVTQHKQ
jgi:hypothetical protein